MKRILVDSNVLLDVLTEDPVWCDWSAAQLDTHMDGAQLCINPIIYAEVSVGFDRIEDLDTALASDLFARLPLPWAATFLAGKAFLQYRRRGGVRTATPPDFYIGAHAAIAGMALLTRDVQRYGTYFPAVEVLGP